MPRPPSEETRRALLEAAAARLARRESVSLRGLARDVGVSTIAIYTYFDGMPGLWANVRQEGFVRLGERLAAVVTDDDPVRHLATLGVAYTEHALANPTLFRVMFDSTAELPDPQVAAGGFEPLVAAVGAAIDEGRFSADTDALEVATRYWSTGHGLVSLVVGGVLPVADLARHSAANAVAQFVAAGDEQDRADDSVAEAWRSVELSMVEG